MNKGLIITFITITILLLGVWMVLPRFIIPQIEKKLASYGFEQVQAHGAVLSLNGLGVRHLSISHDNEDYILKDVFLNWQEFDPRQIEAVSIGDIQADSYLDNPSEILGFPLSDFQGSGTGTAANLPKIKIDHADLTVHWQDRLIPVMGKNITVDQNGKTYDLSASFQTDTDMIKGDIDLGGSYSNSENYDILVELNSVDILWQGQNTVQTTGLNGKANLKQKDITADLTADKFYYNENTLENLKLKADQTAPEIFDVNASGHTLNDTGDIDIDGQINLGDKTAKGSYQAHFADLKAVAAAYPDVNLTNLSGATNAQGQYILSYQNSKIGGTADFKVDLDMVNFQNFRGIDGQISGNYNLNTATLKTRTDFSTTQPELVADTNLTFDRNLPAQTVYIKGKINNLTLPTIGVKSADLDALYHIETKKTDFDLKGATVAMRGNLSKYPNLNGRIKGTYTPPKVDFSFYGNDAPNRFKITANGNYLTSTQSLGVNYTLSPLKQLSESDIGKFFPQFKSIITEFAGTIGAEGRMDYKDGQVISDQKVKLDINSMQLNNIPLNGVAGVIHVKINPSISISDQEIFIGRAELAGLPFEESLIHFDYSGAKNTLHIDDMTWGLAGGTVTSTPFTYDIGNKSADFILHAEKLNLANLFTAVPVDGLTATGLISGEIPVQVINNQFKVNQGHLEAVQTGDIQYDPADVPELFKKDNPYVNMVRDAMKNYNYNILSLTVDSGTSNNQSVVLKARGSNPDFFDGRPVELNLNIEGELEDLLKFNVGAYNLPQRIMEQMNEFKK